jgi:hypothetical protein
MIRDRLIPAVREAFPDRLFVFASPPDPIIKLPSGCAEIGDLAIYDDGGEATVCITEITHGHFNPYDASLNEDQVAQWVTEDVVAFLHGLFSNRVLLFRTPNRGMGGWRLLDGPPDESAFVEGREYFLWSGPYRSGRTGR